MPSRLVSRSGRATDLASVGLWAAAAVVAALQVVGALSRPVSDRLADLHVYWGSVRALLDGGSLYDFAAHNGAPFTYPPFAGLLFTPLALVPEDQLRLVWTAATLAVVVALAMLSRRADGIRDVAPAVGIPLAALLLFASAPVSSNIRFGQVSVVLVVLVMIDCLRMLPARYQGVLTGLAAAIKLTPMIFVLYWWVSGQRRAAVTAAATFAACTGTAWLVLPGESVRFWLTEIWNVTRVGNIATSGNQSLNGMLLRLDVPDNWRMVLAGVIGLPVVVLALIRATRAYRYGEPFAAMVIIGSAGLVFSPVSWTHHQVWLVLAGLLTVGGRRLTMAWFALVVTLMALPVTTVGAGFPGAVLTGNSRLLLAVVVACAVPFAALYPKPAGQVRQQPSSLTPGPVTASTAGDR